MSYLSNSYIDKYPHPSSLVSLKAYAPLPVFAVRIAQCFSPETRSSLHNINLRRGRKEQSGSTVSRHYKDE